jgi:hypothetical protein
VGVSYTSTKGELQVSGTVLVISSAAQAKKAFTIAKSPREVWWLGTEGPLALPSFGDQQTARISPAGSEGMWIVDLLVRKRSTVWALKVVSEHQPAISKADLLATVGTFARKQRARVGNG